MTLKEIWQWLRRGPSISLDLAKCQEELVANAREQEYLNKTIAEQNRELNYLRQEVEFYKSLKPETTITRRRKTWGQVQRELELSHNDDLKNHLDAKRLFTPEGQ